MKEGQCNCISPTFEQLMWKNKDQKVEPQDGGTLNNVECQIDIHFQYIEQLEMKFQ